MSDGEKMMKAKKENENNTFSVSLFGYTKNSKKKKKNASLPTPYNPGRERK